MKKKVVIILIVILVIGLITGGVFLVIDKMDKDKKDKEQQEKEGKIIVEKFELFQEKIKDFNDMWSIYNDLYEPRISSDTTYEYDEWIETLNEYTEAVDGVEEKASELKEKCVGHYYSDTNVSNKCSAFVTEYEQAINLYVADIEGFNLKMKELSNSKNTYDEYELKYEYVDINNDKVFSGKE